ncbi:MAG: hypothetical protein JOZ97_02075 [Candidatus Eremiobacteraeota bacterium]|nr:hypothetical protein [Candidatus Eremiobacteraeota bacterium]
MIEQPLTGREQLGQTLEGYAFTFCKAAFLALIFSRYTLLATAAIAVILYLVAVGYGVREWRCFIKPPWVIVAVAAIAAAQAIISFWYRSPIQL